jgi:plastocyanin
VRTLSLTAAALAAFALSLAPALATTPAAPPATEVRIHNFMFGPMALTVSAGTTVTFVNTDDEPHTVVGVGQTFRSPPLDTGGRFSHVFATPGQYRYFCTLHPQMTGTIVVRPAAGPMAGGH